MRAIGWMGGHPAHPIAPGLISALSDGHVVHTHHMRSFPSRLAVVSTRARRQAAAVTDHGLTGSNWGGVLPKLFDAFLTVSAYSAHELGAPAARTRVIYGGADPTRYAPDPSVTRDGALFVGRLTPHKGIDRLLPALPYGARLKVVGSVGHDQRLPERDYPRLIRFLARGHDVRFLGSVADDDLPAVYRSAAVLVLPSVDRTCYGRPVRVSELLGLVAIEAMASGTPVIASRIGGLPEVVRRWRHGFSGATRRHARAARAARASPARSRSGPAPWRQRPRGGIEQIHLGGVRANAASRSTKRSGRASSEARRRGRASAR